MYSLTLYLNHVRDGGGTMCGWAQRVGMHGQPVRQQSQGSECAVLYSMCVHNHQERRTAKKTRGTKGIWCAHHACQGARLSLTLALARAWVNGVYRNCGRGHGHGHGDQRIIVCLHKSSPAMLGHYRFMLRYSIEKGE